MPRLRYKKCGVHPKYKGDDYVWDQLPRCICKHIYVSENPFGEPREIGQGNHPTPIVLWRQGRLWTLLEVPEDFEGGYDALVEAEWLDQWYETSETNRQTMMRALAVELGWEVEAEDY